MNKLLPLLIITAAMTTVQCKSLRPSQTKSSDDGEADTNKIFASLLGSRQADPDFDAKVAASAASTFASYASFVSDRTPANTLPEDAKAGGTQLDADFPNLAAFIQSTGVTLQSLARDEVRAVVAVTRGDATTVPDIKTGATALKVALLLAHQTQLSGLALAAPRPAPAPAPAPAAPSQPATVGRNALPIYLPGTQTQTPGSPLPAVPVVSSTTIPIGEAQNKASLLLASLGRSYPALKSSPVDADASGSPGTVAPAAGTPAKASRFCGTTKKGRNIYLSSDSAAAGTRCPSDSLRSGLPPIANSEANPLLNDPDNPLNPVDNLGDTAAEAAATSAAGSRR